MMELAKVSHAWPALDEHDNRHQLPQLPHYREAAVFMLELPEAGIAGFIYPWVSAEGMASAAICIFGPGVENGPIQERFEEVAVPSSMDFHDWQVRGLHMRLNEPHNSVDVSFKGERVKISYRFDALHPVFAFSSSRTGCPVYFADERTEQHGRITGVLEIDGKAYPFDTLGQRDHSWGRRIWGVNQHYKWFHATTPNSAVHFFEMQSFGKPKLIGYVVRDGIMAQVEGVDYDYSFDEAMHHTAMTATVRDSEGRDTTVGSKGFAYYQFQADPMVVLNETATTVQIGGDSGVGWIEFCWNRNYLEFAREHVALHV
jgi:hypothetical protein